MGQELFAFRKRTHFQQMVVLAKVLLEKGRTQKEVVAETGLSRSTVARAAAGCYDEDIPPAQLEAMRALEDEKHTRIRHRCMDELLENPEKIEGASGKDLAVIYDSFTKNQELLAGRATSRGEFTDLTPEALKSAIREAQREVWELMKNGATDGELVP